MELQFEVSRVVSFSPRTAAQSLSGVVHLTVNCGM